MRVLSLALAGLVVRSVFPFFNVLFKAPRRAAAPFGVFLCAAAALSLACSASATPRHFYKQQMISGFSPASGAPGTVINVTGSGFTGSTKAWIGAGHDAVLKVVSDSQASVTVPADATTGPVVLINPSHSATSAASFRVTTGSTPPPPTVSSTRQAMWVWGAPDSDALVAFAQAHQVSELFVEVTPTVATDGSFVRLQYLKAIAAAAGIKLYALNGDPGWATNPAAALAWQKAALDTGLFAGAHLDVEPYSLPAWQTDQAGTAAAYLQLLSQLKAAYPLPLEVDVPFWYGTIAAPPGAAAGPTLADAVLAIVDATTVMSYRDTATGTNSIMDVGTDMLVRAQAAGKPVRLAAETNPTPDCAVCSFSAFTATQLQIALGQVESAAGTYRTFDGMAVEDYTGWSKLAP